MRELYPGHYADLQERVRSEAAAADAAYAALEATAPGTEAYDLARINAYYCDLAHGWALLELEEFEKEARHAG